MTNLEQDLIMDLQVFEGVQNFRYLSTLIHSKNLKNDEIKSRIGAGNSCFCSLRQIFRSRAVSKPVKTEIYKIMVQPVTVSGSETWAMTEMDMT